MEGGFIIGIQPDSGTGGGGIPDAPVDGFQYVRRNGNWEVVAVGDEVTYSKRIDMNSDYIYTGEAAIGSPEAGASWRISRTYLAPTDGDVIVLWADGNANFDNVWNNHLSLSYT